MKVKVKRHKMDSSSESLPSPSPNAIFFRETAHNEMLTKSVTEKSQNEDNEALELPSETKRKRNGHRYELSSSSIFFDDVNFVNKEVEEVEEDEEEEEEENELTGLLGVAKDRLRRFSCL